jgi:hypothetical protein
MATKKQEEYANSKENIERLKKLAEARIGKTPWNKDIPMSEEQKQKIKENNWMRGKKPFNTGKKAEEYVSPKGLERMRTSATINLK